MTAELFAAFSAEDLSVKRIVILAVVAADPVLVVMEPLLHLVKQLFAYNRLYCTVHLIVVLFLLMAVPHPTEIFGCPFVPEVCAAVLFVLQNRFNGGAFEFTALYSCETVVIEPLSDLLVTHASCIHLEHFSNCRCLGFIDIKLFIRTNCIPVWRKSAIMKHLFCVDPKPLHCFLAQSSGVFFSRGGFIKDL